MKETVRDIKTKELLTTYDCRLSNGEYEIYCLDKDKNNLTKKRNELLYKRDCENIKFLQNSDYNSLTEAMKWRYDTILGNVCSILGLSKIEVLNIDINSLIIE